MKNVTCQKLFQSHLMSKEKNSFSFVTAAKVTNLVDVITSDTFFFKEGLITQRSYNNLSVTQLPVTFLPPAYVVRGKVIFILGNVCLFTFGGGVPCLRFSGGGPMSQIFGGGPMSQMFGGGPRSQIFRGGPRSQILGGYQVSDFFGGGYPVSVKGKIFDTRFGLIHVQTGKKFFVEGPPPPPVKGTIFDTRFGLIHVHTGKKFFVEGPPP